MITRSTLTLGLAVCLGLSGTAMATAPVQANIKVSNSFTSHQSIFSLGGTETRTLSGNDDRMYSFGLYNSQGPKTNYTVQAQGQKFTISSEDFKKLIDHNPPGKNRVIYLYVFDYCQSPGGYKAPQGCKDTMAKLGTQGYVCHQETNTTTGKPFCIGYGLAYG